MMKRTSAVSSAEMDLENRVVLNVGGTRFETYKTILKKIPATRLSRLTEALVNYDPVTNEYFFDRHPGVFSQILNYYRTGKLHYPINVCGPLFEEELEFWGLDANQVEPCCWKTYTKHRTTEETLACLDRINIDVDKTSKEDLVIKFGIDHISGFTSGKIPFLRRIQPVIWQMFNEPRSSNAAMIVALLQISMIVISVAVLWVSSYSVAKYQILEMNNEIAGIDKNKNKAQPITSFRIIETGMTPFLTAIDYITVAWFTVDLTVRFLVTPNKNDFLVNSNNIFDIVATLLLLFNFVFEMYLDAFLCQCLQVFRVLRLFRLLTYHSGLQVIITSIKLSYSVLQLLIFFMIASSTIYGSLIFYAERLTTDDSSNNLFISIPDAFWYATISLTTIGYGDLSPTTLLGRLFGSACVITGVLMIGLPMTIVVEIFTNLYNHLRARNKLPKQRRRILPVEAPRARKHNTGHGQAGGDGHTAGHKAHGGEHKAHAAEHKTVHDHKGSHPENKFNHGHTQA